MANKKISSLTSLGAAPATDDIIPITDISDTTGSPQGTTKKVTVANLLANAPDNSTDVTLAAVTNNYLTLSGQEITAGIVPVSLGGTGASNLADARANLGVDASGTDNSTDVTLTAVTNNYLTLSGQEITAGIVPVSLGGTGSGDLANARANLGLGTAATTDSTDYATASHTHAIDDLSDVTITSAQTEDVIKFNGTSFVNGQVSVDVDTPLNTALRGTTNPHIGAYPNQSFKVIDNPYKSVMVVADEAGNLKLLNSLGVNNIAVGFSVVEDGVEPDIEVVSGSETYSVISGDSDSKGGNGLPFRQGFNLPDIGANPAPILISGGTIA